MKRKNVLKKMVGSVLSVLLLAGAGLAGQTEIVQAAQRTKSVMLENTALSTDSYTVKNDEYGNRKIWDTDNGQYLYFGGMKWHLLSRDGNRVFLKTAATVSETYMKMEVTDADVWDKLNTVEKGIVPAVNLPRETFTYGSSTFTAPAADGVKVYQLSANDVFKYYGGLSQNYYGVTRSRCYVTHYTVEKFSSDYENFPVYAALNLDLSTVAFTTPVGTAKPSSFQNTSVVENSSNRLTLRDGSGFAATMDQTAVTAGDTVQINVTALPNDNHNRYTQISAMAVASDGSVAAYGKVGDAKTGAVSFRLPSSVRAGTYTLKLFAESVSSNTEATDYASNMISFSLQVGSDNQNTVMIFNPNNTHMKLVSGQETQTVDPGQAIVETVYEVTEYLEPDSYRTNSPQMGYYLPEGYLDGAELNGLTVSIDDGRKTLTISGTPKEDTDLVLPTAAAQTSMSYPKGIYYLGDGKIGGTTSNLVWYVYGTEVRGSCSDGITDTGITTGEIMICVKATPQHPTNGRTGIAPESYHKITTVFDEQYGTVKTTVNGGETPYAGKTADTGEYPKVQVTPKKGYQYTSVEISDSENNTYTWKEDGTFYMRDKDVTVKVVFEKKPYSIMINEAEGGTAVSYVENIAASAAVMDTVVTLQANAAEGYELIGWQNVISDDADKPSITVQDNKFAMPAGNVTVTPIFDLTAEKKAEAAAVAEQITQIGSVVYTAECKTLIDAARAAYENLMTAQKNLIAQETVTVLKDAETAYAALQQQAVAAAAKQEADHAAADAAVQVINAIGEVSYSDTSKAAIDAARIAYNALTADQQALIPADQLAILTNAEAAYAALQQQAEQQKAAEEAAKRAEEEKKAAEEAAKRAEEEKEAADQAAADTAVNAITAIGTVTYSEASKAAIDAARAAYNALTDEQKALIPAEKVTALTDAEAGYTALTAAALAPKLEQKKAGKDSITISWKADQKATAGYRIYIKGGSFKKFTKAADTKKGVTSYMIKKVNKKKLTAGTQYEIKVVSLKKNGKKKAELSAQKLKAVTVTAAPKFTSAARSKNGKNITLKWKKVSGASGYEIQMSTKAKSGFKKIKTVNAKTASYTRKSLSKSKTYYFRIRTYKTVNGTKFYSSWSGVKKVNKK